MRCPRCAIETATAERIESKLVANRCHRCGGHWVGSYQYWRWRESHADAPEPEPPGSSEEVAGEDSEMALLCAECGRFLRKFRVAHDVPFRVDRCGHCGGMWFDEGEWSTLRELGMTETIHDVFTAVWQRKLRQQDSRAMYEQLYRDRFGDAGLTELERIRAWLDQHPEKEAMLRFLSDPDPYA